MREQNKTNLLLVVVGLFLLACSVLPGFLDAAPIARSSVGYRTDPVTRAHVTAQLQRMATGQDPVSPELRLRAAALLQNMNAAASFGDERGGGSPWLAVPFGKGFDQPTSWLGQAAQAALLTAGIANPESDIENESAKASGDYPTPEQLDSLLEKAGRRQPGPSYMTPEPSPSATVVGNIAGRLPLALLGAAFLMLGLNPSRRHDARPHTSDHHS